MCEECDCYGCVTMRHPCQYEKTKEKKMTKRKKTTPLTREELEHFVLNHIAAWVEADAEQFNYEEKNFYELPQIYRNELDQFTNSFRARTVGS